jgi:hypothetical protein
MWGLPALREARDRDASALQSRFYFRGSQSRSIIFDKQFLARRGHDNAFDAVDRVCIGYLSHQGLIERALQTEVLLNFGHGEKSDYSETQWLSGPAPAPSPGAVPIAVVTNALASPIACTRLRPRARKAVMAAE